MKSTRNTVVATLALIMGIAGFALLIMRPNFVNPTNNTWTTPQSDTPAQENLTGCSDNVVNTVCLFQISPDESPMRFDLSSDAQTRLVHTIEVYSDKDQQTLTQTLDAEMEEPPLSNQPFFTTTDFNSDGYQDLKLLYAWGATGNVYYHVWLYNQDTKQFDRHTGFDELSNLQVNPDSGMIHTYSVGGLAGAIYFSGDYEFNEQNELILVYGIGQEVDPNNANAFVCTTQQRNTQGLLVSTTKQGTCIQD